MCSVDTYEEGRRICTCRDMKLPETGLQSSQILCVEVKAGTRLYEASPGGREKPLVGPEKEVGQIQWKKAEGSGTNAPLGCWHFFQAHLGFSVNLRACHMQKAPELASDSTGSGTGSRGVERKLVAERVRALTDTGQKHRPRSGE